MKDGRKKSKLTMIGFNSHERKYYTNTYILP
jgi:hypothetical protein